MSVTFEKGYSTYYRKWKAMVSDEIMGMFRDVRATIPMQVKLTFNAAICEASDPCMRR